MEFFYDLFPLLAQLEMVLHHILHKLFRTAQTKYRMVRTPLPKLTNPPLYSPCLRHNENWRDLMLPEVDGVDQSRNYLSSELVLLLPALDALLGSSLV